MMERAPLRTDPFSPLIGRLALVVLISSVSSSCVARAEQVPLSAAQSAGPMGPSGGYNQRDLEVARPFGGRAQAAVARALEGSVDIHMHPDIAEVQGITRTKNGELRGFDLEFDPDLPTLAPISVPHIKKVALFLKKNSRAIERRPQWRLLLSWNPGEAADKLQQVIGQARAEMVQKAFITQGIPKSRIQIRQASTEKNTVPVRIYLKWD